MENRSEMIAFLRDVFKHDDPSTQKKFYGAVRSSGILTEAQMIGLWYGTSSISSVSDDILNYLFAVLRNDGAYRSSQDYVEEFYEATTSPSIRHIIITMLRNSVPRMENLLRKPVYEFNEDEAKAALVALEEYEIASLRQICGIVRKFVEWVEANKQCEHIDHGFSTVNVIELPLDKAIRHTIHRTPLETLKYILPHQQFCEGNVPIIAMLLWHGLTVDDIVALRKTDVDLDRGVLHVGGRQIPILADVLDGFRQYAATESYKGGRGGGVTYYACSCKEFVKKFNPQGEGSPLDKAYVFKLMSKFADRHYAGGNNPVKTKLISDSYAFDYLYRIEQERDLTDDDFANAFHVTDNRKVILDKQAMYIAYKEAFDLT